LTAWLRVNALNGRKTSVWLPYYPSLMNSNPFGRGGPNPVNQNRLGGLGNYIGNEFVLADSSKPLKACPY